MLKRIVKKISVLSSGSLISAVINALSYPIITQVYSPSDYGEYSLLIFYSAIFASSSLLKLDLIIPTLNETYRLKQYSIAAVINIAMVSIIGGCFSLIFLGLDVSSFTLFLLVLICVSSFGIFSLVGAIMLFHGNALAFGSLIAGQAILALAIQITLGVIGFSWYGLFFGYVCSFLLSSVLVFFAFLPKEIFRVRSEFSPTHYFSIMQREKKRWGPNVVQSVLNSVSLNIMIVGVDYISGKESAGLFAFCQKLLVIPVRLVGNSAKQVLLRELSLSSRHQMLSITKNLTVGLALLSVAIFSGINLVSGYLIEIGLGAQWRGVDLFVLPVSIWLAFTIIYVPSVALLNVNGYPKYHMLYETVNLASRFLVFFISIALGFSDVAFLYISSILNAFLCIVLVVITFNISFGEKA